MSANNKLIIKKRKNRPKYDIFMNHCVDNEFKYNKEDKLKTEGSLIKAIRWCNNYMLENIVEYGYVVVEDKTNSAPKEKNK